VHSDPASASPIAQKVTGLKFIPTESPDRYDVQVELESWKRGGPELYENIPVQLEINGSYINEGHIDILCCLGGDLCHSSPSADPEMCLTLDDCSPPGKRQYLLANSG
jgi:hypothetical protein